MKLALPCFVVAVLLALVLGRFDVARLPQVVQGDDALSVAFGDARSTISAAMVHKADSYFHGGIDMECKEHHDHHDDHDHDHDHSPNRSLGDCVIGGLGDCVIQSSNRSLGDCVIGGLGDCVIQSSNPPIPQSSNPPILQSSNHPITHSHTYDPWRWINQQVRAPEKHVHLEGEKSVELMPWFWASVKADPHNIDAWTTAWYTANTMLKDQALARRILDEAKAKNPDSLEIAWTEARFVYQGGKGDVAAAMRLLEEARRLGKRKCGGRLSELAPHEAEAFCNILGYLSKILYDRGERDRIRPLLDEARATGADTPVVGEIEARQRPQRGGQIP